MHDDRQAPGFDRRDARCGAAALADSAMFPGETFRYYSDIAHDLIASAGRPYRNGPPKRSHGTHASGRPGRT
jgi:hypothetical protein